MRSELSDIRGKPHRRAEADSLHVLHLPSIKKPGALWLLLLVSRSHSLPANYLSDSLQPPLLRLSDSLLKLLPFHLFFFPFKLAVLSELMVYLLILVDDF